MSTTLSTTLIALAMIGLAGAALLTGHASFDQFLGVAVGFGAPTALTHAVTKGAG